jgi:hypothetical protein
MRPGAPLPWRRRRSAPGHGCRWDRHPRAAAPSSVLQLRRRAAPPGMGDRVGRPGPGRPVEPEAAGGDTAPAAPPPTASNPGKSATYADATASTPGRSAARKRPPAAHVRAPAAAAAGRLARLSTVSKSRSTLNPPPPPPRPPAPCAASAASPRPRRPTERADVVGEVAAGPTGSGCRACRHAPAPRSRAPPPDHAPPPAARSPAPVTSGMSPRQTPAPLSRPSGTAAIPAFRLAGETLLRARPHARR